MLVKFEQSIGPVGDVKELEYITALHQSDKHNLRRDSTIRAEDIRSFLASRYGIIVSDEQVQQTILHGLGGGDGEQEVLDLMELVACLQIPVLLKGGYGMKLPKEVVPSPDNLLEYALKIIIHDVTGGNGPKSLTPELMEKILMSYGEHELAADKDLIVEMIDATKASKTTTGSSLLTVESFARALTKDVELYDLRNEIRATTNLDDVFLDEKDQEDLLNEKIAAAAEDHVRRADVEDPSDSGFVSIADNVRDLLTVRLKLKRVQTLPQIDPIAGTFRSKALMVLLWITFLVTYFTRVLGLFQTDVKAVCGTDFQYSYTEPWVRNRDTILCEAFAGVVFWLVFFVGMMILGTTVVLLGSTGNSIDCKKWWVPLVGATSVGLSVLLPYFFWDAVFVRKETELELPAELPVELDQSDRYVDIVSFLFGFATICFHLGHTGSLLAGKYTIFQRCLPPTWFVRNSVFAEMELKRVASIKLSRMARNGLDMVRVGETDDLLTTYYGRALQSFSKAGSQVNKVGGFFWTWKRLLSNKVYKKDGILIPGRMVASNIAQFIIFFYIIIAGRRLIGVVNEQYDTGAYLNDVNRIVKNLANTQPNEDLVATAVTDVTLLVSGFLMQESQTVDFGCDDVATSSASLLALYCSGEGSSLICTQDSAINYICPLLSESDLDPATQLAFLAGAGFDQETLQSSTQFALQQATDDAVNSLYPSQKYMVVAPVTVATLFASITALYLAVTYIPSTVITILRLRCGNIETLHDPRFWIYRKAPDQVAILTGSVFWGCFVSSLVVGSVVGLVVFFFLWQATAFYAQRFIGTIIGMLGIFLIRLVAIRCARKKLYRVFYRQQPGKANIMVLAMEWASFALSAGYILSRLFKLALAAFTCIGRVDTPFLAPGVGRLACIDLDNYPHVHRKEVLTHEAHRHPYIEMLGVIYLMKMRYADNFGSRAGSCWRLLYVHALMPWLHKYRVLARPELLSERNEATLDFNDAATFISLSRRDLSDRSEGGTKTPYKHLSPLLPEKALGAEYENEQTSDQAEREAYAYMRISELEDENQRLRKELELAKKQR